MLKIMKITILDSLFLSLSLSQKTEIGSHVSKIQYQAFQFRVSRVLTCILTLGKY